MAAAESIDAPDAATAALDAIAALCGCPEWEYPGQVVRDVEALKAGVERLRAVLRRVEWVNTGGRYPHCPICHGVKCAATPSGHTSQCELAALLREARPGDAKVLGEPEE